MSTIVCELPPNTPRIVVHAFAAAEKFISHFVPEREITSVSRIWAPEDCTYCR